MEECSGGGGGDSEHFDIWVISWKWKQFGVNNEQGIYSLYRSIKSSIDKKKKKKKKSLLIFRHIPKLSCGFNWKLICTITTRLGAWRWQLCKTLVRHTCCTHRRMQKEHKENSFNGRENTSTSGEFREIWRCFQWCHSREESYTSRRRIIAQAQISSAFISPKVEVIYIWNMANCDTIAKRRFQWPRTYQCRA